MAVMEAIWRYFKVNAISISLTTKRELQLFLCLLQVQLPGYLKSLPLPKTAGGFMELTRSEWLELLPFILFLFILLYLVLSPFLGFLKEPRQRRPRINRKQKLTEAKVKDCVDVEDLGKETAFCRCWKSKKVITEYIIPVLLYVQSI